MKALTPEWFAHHRENISRWHRRDLGQILEDLEQLKIDVWHLIDEDQHTPSTVAITATSQGAVMAQFPENATIDLVADVKNAESVDIPDTVSWTTTGGTITPNPTDSRNATLVNTPLGDVTVTATTSNGISATYTVTTVDSVPASITVTGSAAA